MKNIKSLLLVLTFGAFFIACETEMVDKVDTFNLPSGGYMRIVTPFPVVAATTFTVSKKNMGGTKAEMVHEAVTLDKGALFANYDLEIRFVGATTTAYKAFKSIPASAYTKDPTTGYPRHTLTITGTEAMTSLGLDTSKIVKGNKFELKATMKLSDGKSYNTTNTGTNILSGAFYSSPFFYTLNVVD
jgi:hypothetical protein